MKQQMESTRRVLSRPEKQRAIGSVQGAAVGDALGAPWEFQPRGSYTQRFPQPVLGGQGEMTGGGTFGWALGEFTDDTQMAMALAEALLECGGYDADAVWKWFRAWVRTGRDVGVTTRGSLDHADWRDVPPNPRGAGNGALMRVFPMALAFLDAPDDVARKAVLHHALLTHHDLSAGWGAWIAVAMMRTAILGGDPVAAVPSLVDQLPADIRPKFDQLLASTWTPDDRSQSNGNVWGCLAQAVWCLRTTTSFEDAVVAAVSLGDDADTVACVTGALAGATYGAQAIPSRWVTYVHGSIDSPRGHLVYRAHDLQRIALELIGVTDRPMTPPEPAAGPVEVAPGLFAADLLGAAGVPDDWAVVSLTRTADTFLHHPVRRQLSLIDEAGDHNPGLGLVVDDAVRAIDAFLAENRNVVVHCHGGRSRTGLVLKAWKMCTDGVTEREAHGWLAATWPRYADYNQSFVEYLRGSEPELKTFGSPRPTGLIMG